MSARTMDSVQEFPRLPHPSEGQRRHESRKTAFVTHATDRTGHYVGTKSLSGTLFTSTLAHPRIRQTSWTSVFLPSLKLGGAHSHKTRSCGTGLAHVRESRSFSGVALSGRRNESHPNESNLHATEVSIPILSLENDKDSFVVSTTKPPEVPLVPTKPRPDTSRVIEPVRRVPRPARPSYSQEQKFFIMYHRVIMRKSWEELGELFREFFGLRTKDGLNSVYYRMRHEWGMKQVLDSCAEDSEADRMKVEKMATMVSRDFLQKIGYPLGD